MFRELDLLIAENVFGIKKVYHHSYDTDYSGLQYIPSGKPWRTHHIDAKGLSFFSSNPVPAYQVMQRVTDKYHWVIKSPFTKDGLWFAGLTPLGTTGWNGKPDFTSTGRTMMEAVCKCILSTKATTNKIKMVEVNKEDNNG